MELKGIVHEVGATQQISETFKKRDLIVQYAENPDYPEYIKLEALQDKVSLFDELRPGDEVEAYFNLRGRPWTDKQGKTSYFNSLVIWRLAINTASAAPAYAAPQQATDPTEDDDLPF